ncbi:hypothetical protein GCM10009560_00820 [Nonomuraea longicatena]|uniref:Uncharacterized protein n=1 Tax=Nonomuraea longicatena TaxID=83682 RepID=A0ABN1NLS9_9ACTN
MTPGIPIGAPETLRAATGAPEIVRVAAGVSEIVRVAVGALGGALRAMSVRGEPEARGRVGVRTVPALTGGGS